jgi:hypothetical protein
MFPKKHIIHGFIFTLFLYITLGIPKIFPFIIIFLSTFLFDVDHYILYVWRKKDFSLKNAYQWHVDLINEYIDRKTHKPLPHFFHAVEFLILMIILSFFNQIILYMTIGLLFHSILDFHQLAKENRLYMREYFLTKILFEWMF